MAATDRIAYAPVPGAQDLFTNDFIEYLVALHDRFTPTIHDLRRKRVDVLDRALNKGQLPAHLARVRGQHRGLDGASRT